VFPQDESPRRLDASKAVTLRHVSDVLPNRLGLRELSAGGGALTARLRTLFHRFAFVFSALCRAGRAQIRTDTAQPLNEL
jgi:hypothetical protein